MAAKEAPKPEGAVKEAIPRGMTTTLSGMQNQGVLWADPDMCGYLEKRGGRFTSWKRRYFILQGYFLYYFISEQQTETPLGLIPIEACTIKETADVGGKLRRYVFYLNIGAQHVGFAKAETYILAAASRESLEEWTEKLVLAAENREELYGDLRSARAVVGEIRGLLALSPSEKRLFASLHGEEARALQLELIRACTEKDELKREIEAASIEADRQESALLQQLILWDIMSLTDPGREPSEDYLTLSRLQDEVRYSDEIYRLLYKRGSLFQGDGLHDLKKGYRGLLVSLVRQVLDLIEDHHAKIRSKAPRFSFNVDPAIYDDMFYMKVPVQEEEQSALELLARASKEEDDSDEEGTEEGDEDQRASQRASVKQQGLSKALSVRRTSSSPRRASASSPRRASASSPRAAKQQPIGGPMPKLFPDQKTYQLTRSPSQGWQVAPAPGGSPTPAPPPMLRKRTHFYENPNVLGSVVTGRTIADVSAEGPSAKDEEDAAAAGENPLRRRVQGIDPIFMSHFGPETRPPASHIKHDVLSSKPVPASVPAESPPGSLPQPCNRPNVLAYIKGTIPRAKSVRPLRPSEAAALAEAAAAKQPQQQQQQQRQSVTPPRSRPGTPDASSGASSSSSRSRSGSTPTSSTPTPRSKSKMEIVIPSADSAVSSRSSSGSPPKARASVVKFKESLDGSASAASSSSSSSSRSRPVVKFADEGKNAISITGPGVAGKALFIAIDPEALQPGPSYGRIRDFPIVVPSILNSEVGLTFPENTDLFSPLPDDDESEDGFGSDQ